MRDIDVRVALRRHLSEIHNGDHDTRVVEEMGIWAHSVRIDVAVINGELCGFELKSARDTLERLPFQAELYSKVFDRVTLVVAERHADKARGLIPHWWGVSVARETGEQVQLSTVHQAALNPDLCALHVARLLWKPEALAILEKCGQARGFKSKASEIVASHLASVVPLSLLRDEVRLALKARPQILGQPVRH